MRGGTPACSRLLSSKRCTAASVWQRLVPSFTELTATRPRLPLSATPVGAEIQAWFFLLAFPVRHRRPPLRDRDRDQSAWSSLRRAQAWPRSSQVLFCARDDASCQRRGRGQWSSTRWRGRGDEEDGEDDRDEGDEKSEVSSAMLADDLLSLSVVEEAQGWMELDVAGSGRSPPRTRHRGMQREWPRGVFTEGWSTARSDRWVHEGRGWGARRMEGRGSETTKGMMRSTGTTSTRMRNGNSSSGRGARSPYSENIHSEAHPCEVVAEGVLLRLSPGRRKCC